MSPTRRVKPGDSKDALDGQLFMHSATGAALEGLQDEEENGVEGRISEGNFPEQRGGLRFQGEALQRLLTMRETIAGDFDQDENQEGVMQEFQFQRRRDSSVSDVGLFQHALDSDESDNENGSVGKSTGAVVGTANAMGNDCATAGSSCLNKQCKALAISSLKAGTSGSMGCFTQGEYPESTRLLRDEVDQRRSERWRGLTLGPSLSRGVLSLHRQRDSGDLIYQQVREEDEDKENEAKENNEEQNANEQQQAMLPTEENREPENEEVNNM